MPRPCNEIEADLNAAIDAMLEAEDAAEEAWTLYYSFVDLIGTFEAEYNSANCGGSSGGLMASSTGPSLLLRMKFAAIIAKHSTLMNKVAKLMRLPGGQRETI